jgi:hypothetical protein
MSKHAVVGSPDGTRLVCKCGWTPNYAFGFDDELSVPSQGVAIEGHIKSIAASQQAVTDYLDKRQATVFLKEVDNAWNE